MAAGRLFPAFFVSLTFFSLCEAQTGAWYIDTIAGAIPPLNDGGAATSTIFGSPDGVAADSSGVYFSDATDHRVRKIDSKGIITTVAGTGQSGYSGDSGPALQAALTEPRGLALDASGNLYIADSGANVVRKVNSSGIISTVAGTGFRGFTTVTGKALTTPLNLPYALALDSKGILYIGEGSSIRTLNAAGDLSPIVIGSLPLTLPFVQGLAFDSAGNLYASSFSMHRIVKITPERSLIYLAGTGETGFAGDGGPASEARFNGPKGIAIDASGALWICDSGNGRIRRIAPDGTVRSAVGSGYYGYNGDQNNPLSVSLGLPGGIAFDPAGNLFWTEQQSQIVRRLPAGSTFVARIGGVPFNSAGSRPAASLILRNPHAVASDAFGYLYLADTGRNVVWKISSTGTASILAGTGVPGSEGAFGPATSTFLNQPMGVSTDSKGNVYIADTGNARILKVDSAGASTRILGEAPIVVNNQEIAPGLVSPVGVRSDVNGQLLVTDSGLNGVIGPILAGPPSFYPGLPSPPDAGLKLPMNAIFAPPFPVTDTEMYPPQGPTAIIADTGNHNILRTNTASLPRKIAGNGGPGYYGDGGPASQSGLNSPSDVALDSKGNIYIADTGNNRIRMIDTAGNISTIAGNGKAGFSGDGGAALNASLSAPTSINVDSQGNIEIADMGNQRIRMLHFVQSGPDFGVSLETAAKTVNRGQSGSFNVTFSSLVGFSGFVTLTASAPAGVTVTFAPANTTAVAPNTNKVLTATVAVPVTQPTGPITITFTAASGSLKHTATATVTVTDQPFFTSAGVVNAASYYSDAVAPGEIIAIFGQNVGPAALVSGVFDSDGLLARTAGDTRVLFDGIAAPMVYAQAGQIAAIVPYEIAGQTSTTLQIEYNGQRSAPLTLKVTDAAPALFNLPSSDQAAALNEDLTLNGPSNPAAAGSTVVFFGTGEGQTSPAGITGKLADTTPFPVPLRPLSVNIGGRSAMALYAAAAPGEVAGLFQINAKVPAGLPPGKATVVVISGTRIGNSLSTIYVK